MKDSGLAEKMFPPSHRMSGQVASYPAHVCEEECPTYELSAYVVAKRCGLCKRLLSARDRNFWKRLIGVFWDNV